MFKTRVSIDWYSFTLPAFPEYFDPSGLYPEYAGMALEKGLGAIWTYIVGEKSEWVAAKSRPPYTTAIQRGNMFYLYAGASQAHVLLECSGKGCNDLERRGLLDMLIGTTAERTTRIDIAHDWETAIRPMQVHDDGFSSKFKTVTTIVSSTGETFYLGSPKSEKRVRVYVYNKPHPRAGVLRFEYIFRKSSAKALSARLINESLEDIVSSCISTYGWKSEFLKQERTSGLTNIRPDRGNAKTLRWIVLQVAPAIRRLIEDDVIENPEEFFNANFMP